MAIISDSSQITVSGGMRFAYKRNSSRWLRRCCWAKATSLCCRSINPCAVGPQADARIAVISWLLVQPFQSLGPHAAIITTPGVMGIVSAGRTPLAVEDE